MHGHFGQRQLNFDGSRGTFSPRLCWVVACIAFTPTLLGAQSLRITGGIVDDQVVQRDASGRASLAFEGTASATGSRTVDGRVLRRQLALEGFDWKPVGRATGGKWQAEIAGVPAGGPYRVELRMGGSTEPIAVRDVLIGDLWILAGQSNMVGYGDLQDVVAPDPQVHSFDMSDRWELAEEPLHLIHGALDRVHWPLNAEKQPERYEGERLRAYVANRKKGAGLGLPFAVEMVRRTGIPIGLIPCAHGGWGGLTMDAWDPALKGKGGDSLYGSMLRRVQAAGGKVKGILWYQGESDVPYFETFAAKFERFVSTLRSDLGAPALPFYYVQIGRVIRDSPVGERNPIRELQRKAEAKIPHAAMTASIDLALDDQGHIGTQDLKRLGTRLANLALRDLFPAAGRVQRGPRLVSALRVNAGLVRLVFSDVNGRLEAAGRMSGFSIHSPGGEPVPAIYKAIVDPDQGNAVLVFVTKLPDVATISYGYEKDAYCNVRDSADMPLPAFGPIPIEGS